MGATVKQIISELHREFEVIYGKRLEKMLLFGSRARGDAEPGSDIDVLVVLKGPVGPGAEILKTGEIKASLSLKYNVVVSCTFISSDRYASEQSPLLLNIRREGIPA